VPDKSTTYTLMNVRKKLKQNSQTKRGRLSDHVEELKKKKARLQQDISSLDTSADALLTKAETTRA